MIGRRRHGGYGAGSRVPAIRVRLLLLLAARRAARAPGPVPWWRARGAVRSLRRYRLGLPT